MVLVLMLMGVIPLQSRCEVRVDICPIGLSPVGLWDCCRGGEGRLHGGWRFGGWCGECLMVSGFVC